MSRAFEVDALFEIDRPAELAVERRIARGDALHACLRIAVTVGAGFAGGAAGLGPERYTLLHPEHAGIGGVVILHRPGLRRHERGAGTARVLRDIIGVQRIRGEQQRRGQDGAKPSHSTVIAALAVALKPLSPIHSKSKVPLSATIVKNEMNGFAATAGNRSARKISAPL